MKPIGPNGLAYRVVTAHIECASCGSVMAPEPCDCNGGETWPGVLNEMDPKYGPRETGVCTNCQGCGENYICNNPECPTTYADKIVRKELCNERKP